ncbi:MAG: serine hydrolase [Lachnospiraceae bacterium]|nr:serine hydrolase [Lachnospiraceae bacterium]
MFIEFFGEIKYYGIDMIEDSQYSKDVLHSDLMERLDAEDIERKKRAALREIRRRKRRKRRLLKLYIRVGVLFFAFIAVIILIFLTVRKVMSIKNPEIAHESLFGVIEHAFIEEPEEEEPEPEPEQVVYSAYANDMTKGFGEDVIGQYAILVDVNNDTILAQREAKSRMYPASMTKVLTLLVAAEHVNDLEDKFTIDIDIINYSYNHDLSMVGFKEGEVVTVRDLLYGTILPSGADAAVGLACYVAGSHEAFVDMMNQKLAELELSETSHFTNCVGLYDDDHYSTAYDIAMIMEAAMNNDICRQVLGTRKFTTSSTALHPEGLDISNWFLRRIEDKQCGVTFEGAKTGYVHESGNCAVSYAVTPDGNAYICVIGNSLGNWRCIYDHVAIYKQFFDSAHYVPMTDTEVEQQIEQDRADEAVENVNE